MIELIKAAAAFLVAILFLAIAVGFHRSIFSAPTRPIESIELAVEVTALVCAFALFYVALTSVADFRVAYRLVGV